MSDIQDAIIQVQKTQQAAEDAIQELGNHNNSEEAHPYILNMLRKIVNSDAIYTNDQIVELITKQLGVHKDTPFDEAHPGWDEFKASLDEKFTEIETKYNELKDRVDQWYNSQGTSDLNQQIQEVMNKYSPILENLQAAYQQAIANNQDALAESYKQSINETLTQQNQEIMAVIEKWQQAQKPETPTVQIYVTFQSNGGSGDMPTQYLNQGEDFTYPECTFTAPVGYEFDKWSSNSTGDGTYTGAPGESFNTADISNNLTLYAIWKLIPITEEALTQGITLKSKPNAATVTMKLVKSMRS